MGTDVLHFETEFSSPSTLTTERSLSNIAEEESLESLFPTRRVLMVENELVPG